MTPTPLLATRGRTAPTDATRATTGDGARVGASAGARAQRGGGTAILGLGRTAWGAGTRPRARVRATPRPRPTTPTPTAPTLRPRARVAPTPRTAARAHAPAPAPSSLLASRETSSFGGSFGFVGSEDGGGGALFGHFLGSGREGGGEGRAELRVLEDLGAGCRYDGNGEKRVESGRCSM